MPADSCSDCWQPARPAERGSWRRWAALALLLASGTAVAGQVPTPELRARVRAVLEQADSFEDRYDAQVWLTDMASRLGNQVADPALRVEILKAAHREASRARLPPEMVLAVIDVESAFNPYAISSAGAQGLMQVMPFWRKELGHRRLVDVADNLLMGCTILRYYYDMEKGDWNRALARYNGSLGRPDYPQKVLDRLSRRWFQQ
ncbi:MAG: lytic transglycosylase domain-containing protein [Gammaproteobacteria bacterium]|nr:lytic transglycosylase domain-containing protein [Gammaproteobacteria bacterium]QOJ33320.1 MAG: lytic transglycosylase domain-containing protein [Gammaproteobacteria bacterium]